MRKALQLLLVLLVVTLAAPSAEAKRVRKPSPYHTALVDLAAELHADIGGRPVNAERRVIASIERAVAADCHAGEMVDGDHYREPTWALGSCLLDAKALLASAWEEGHFCEGGPPKCPRGDNGRSASTFQVSGWKDSRWDADLTDLYERDLDAAAKSAYAVIRWGAKTCPREPLAPYCGGCSGHALELGHARLERLHELEDEFAEAP